MQDSLINVVLWFALLQISKGLCEVIVQDNGFMAKLANQKILLLDLRLERQGSLQLLPCGFQSIYGVYRLFLGFQHLFAKLSYLRLGVLNNFS